MVTQAGRLPSAVVVAQINRLMPSSERPFVVAVETQGVGELIVNAAHLNHVVFVTNGETWAEDTSGVQHLITYDVVPDAVDLALDYLKSLGLHEEEEDGQEEQDADWPSEDYVEMPPAAEAMLADAAPVFELDGLPGLHVRSRTPEHKRQPGQHLSSYQVMGSGRSRSCTCPAARHGRKCWHLTAANTADAWEKAARDLYDVLSRRGTASPEVKARVIIRTWEQILEETPRTVRGDKLDVPQAMSRFIGFASMAVSKIHYNKHAAQREFVL
jgi:hypothetical protein